LSTDVEKIENTDELSTDLEKIENTEELSTDVEKIENIDELSTNIRNYFTGRHPMTCTELSNEALEKKK